MTIPPTQLPPCHAIETCSLEAPVGSSANPFVWESSNEDGYRSDLSSSESSSSLSSSQSLHIEDGYCNICENVNVHDENCITLIPDFLAAINQPDPDPVPVSNSIFSETVEDYSQFFS